MSRGGLKIFSAILRGMKKWVEVLMRDGERKKVMVNSQKMEGDELIIELAAR